MTKPSVSFYPEWSIQQRVFDGMDCFSEEAGRVTRWFAGYPEFTITSGKYGLVPNYGTFEISIERLNALYSTIKGLFPQGEFSTPYATYPVTVTQVFRAGSNVWAALDGQSYFYCSAPQLPEEYQEWGKLAEKHDYTYMMSDSGSAHRRGNEAAMRMVELMRGLDVQVCALWYNFVLRRQRVNPQSACFGMNQDEIWNTLENCYKVFGIVPQPHPEV